MGVLINPVSRRMSCGFQFWMNNVSHYYKRYYPMEFNNLVVYLKFLFRRFFKHISKKNNKYRELRRFKLALFFNLLGFRSESAVITLVFFINDIFGFSFGTKFWKLREMFKYFSKRLYFTYIRSFHNKDFHYCLKNKFADDVFWKERRRGLILKKFIRKFRKVFKNKEKIIPKYFKLIFSSNSKPKFVKIAISYLMAKVRRDNKFIILFNEIFNNFSNSQVLAIYNKPYYRYAFLCLLRSIRKISDKERIRFLAFKNSDLKLKYDKGVFRPLKYKHKYYDRFKLHSGNFPFINRFKLIFLEKSIRYFEKVRNDRFRTLKMALFKGFSVIADKIINRMGFLHKNLIMDFQLENVLRNFGVFSYAQVLAQWLRFKFMCGFRVNKLLKEFRKFVQVLNFRTKSFLGYKVCLSGRFTRARIATYRYAYFGKTPFTTLNTKFDYGFCTWIAQFGICGIKVWLHYDLAKDIRKKKNRRIFNRINTDEVIYT